MKNPQNPVILQGLAWEEGRRSRGAAGAAGASGSGSTCTSRAMEASEWYGHPLW
jgi:hypothetical protein